MVRQRAWKERRYLLVVGLAASVLLLAAWIVSLQRHGTGDGHSMAATMGEYVSEFSRDPLAAQRNLVSHYQGRETTVEQAIRLVGFRPAAADGLPRGYQARTTLALRMPCCVCVQCLCERPDGSMIAIFEHAEDAPHGFGDHPTSHAICHGIHCNVVESGNQLAASWKHGQRRVTIVGARDSDEINVLVAWFDRKR